MAVPVVPDPNAVHADHHHDDAEQDEGYDAPAPTPGPDSPERVTDVGDAHGAVLAPASFPSRGRYPSRAERVRAVAVTSVARVRVLGPTRSVGPPIAQAPATRP